MHGMNKVLRIFFPEKIMSRFDDVAIKSYEDDEKNEMLDSNQILNLACF